MLTQTFLSLYLYSFCDQTEDLLFSLHLNFKGLQTSWCFSVRKSQVPLKTVQVDSVIYRGREGLGIRHLEGYLVARKRGFLEFIMEVLPWRILKRISNIHLDNLQCKFLSSTRGAHNSSSRPKGLLTQSCLIIMKMKSYPGWCLLFSECVQTKKKKIVLNSDLCKRSNSSRHNIIFTHWATQIGTPVSLSVLPSSPSFQPASGIFSFLSISVITDFVRLPSVSQRISFNCDFSCGSQITTSVPGSSAAPGVNILKRGSNHKSVLASHGSRTPDNLQGGSTLLPQHNPSLWWSALSFSGFLLFSFVPSSVHSSHTEVSLTNLHHTHPPSVSAILLVPFLLSGRTLFVLLLRKVPFD